MSIKKSFETVLDNYLQIKYQKVGIDQSSLVFQEIEKVLPQKLGQHLNSENMLVTGSVGVGRWAEVPWIGIFNKKITVSAQRGFYVCYLFTSNMESIYLTMIHSITKGDSGGIWGKEHIKSFIEGKRKTLKTTIEKKHYNLSRDIVVGEPIYFGKSERAKKYSESTIAYKEYKKGSIPSEDELIKDLYKFMDLYDFFAEAEGYVKNSSLEVRNNDAKVVFESDKEVLEHIHAYLTSRGFLYSEENIANLYLSLRSKPFVIISGISGTGKTKIVQLFAESVGATEDNGQFKLISVRPDWSDSSDLLGYKNLQDQFVEGQLTEIVKRAHEYPALPHFVVLDEMNLARVEYYLSEFLSIMESRRVDEDGQIVSSPLVTTNDGAFSLPNNLYIIGTVNMDETTHPFSKKVLDRANTIEFNEIRLNHFTMFEEDKEEVAAVRVGNEQFESKYLYLKQAYGDNKALIQKVSAQLEKINEQLQTIYAQVGYRVRDEICFYMLYNDEMKLLSEEQAFDFCVMQKILPRISGADSTVEDLLKNLYEQFAGKAYDNGKTVSESAAYPRSAKKVAEMLNRLYKDGFTSFWVS